MEVSNAKFTAILRCDNCHAPLHSEGNCFVCQKCGLQYPIKNGVPFLIPASLIEQYKEYQKEAQSPINKFKVFIKRYPCVFQFLRYAIGSNSYFGWSPRKALKELYRGTDLKDKVIMNIGAGTEIIHSEVINADIFPFKNVNLVIDATRLPMQDNSVDMIMTDSALEHIPDAERAIQEIYRVIKPGGFVYIDIPFMIPFHASPNDYLRLTHEGLRHKFSAFEEYRIGTRGGPASALVSLLMHFFALPFSLVSTSVYHFMTYVFMAILSPLRIFDLLFVLFPASIEAAAVIYFIGKKK